MERLNHFSSFATETDGEFRMIFHEGANGRLDFLDVSAFRQLGHHRDVIGGRSRILQTIHIHTLLRITERIRQALWLRRRRLSISRFRSLVLRTEQMLEDFILYRLDGTCLHQFLCMKRHSKSIVDEDSEFDRRYGCQTHIAQHRSDTEIAMSHNA